MLEALDPKDIQSGLQTQNLGKHLLFFEQLTSTNTYLMNLASQGEPEGTVVLAEEQTEGRGRLGRTWDAPPGTSLLFSVLLRPKGRLADASKLSLVAALAVLRTIKEIVSLASTIKWPNDVLIAGKKVCGILVETNTATGASSPLALILGVGLNVNQGPEDFPLEFREQATSLRLETGQEQSRIHLMRSLLESLEGLYLLFEQFGFPYLLTELRQASAVLGKRVTVRAGMLSVEGTVVDLDNEGRLLLKLDSGSVTFLSSGEITSIRSL